MNQDTADLNFQIHSISFMNKYFAVYFPSVWVAVYCAPKCCEDSLNWVFWENKS